MSRFSILLLSFLFISFSIHSQKKTETGPVIKDFGPVYKVKNSEVLLKPGKKYKAIFDVFTNPGKADEPNPLITTVARYLNMHVQNGIKAKDLDAVLILHGKATAAALSDDDFRSHFGKENPDYKVLKALDKAGVKIFVCGQSFTYRGYKPKELSRYVSMSLSALSALVHYQTEGYALITFNQ